MTTHLHDDEHGSRFDYWAEYPLAAPAWEEIEAFDDLGFDPYDDWYASGGEMLVLETVNSYVFPGVVIVDAPEWLHSALYSDYQDPSDDGEPVDIPASVLRALTPEE